MESNDGALDAAFSVLAGANYLLGEVIEPIDIDNANRKVWI